MDDFDWHHRREIERLTRQYRREQHEQGEYFTSYIHDHGRAVREIKSRLPLYRSLRRSEW